MYNYNFRVDWIDHVSGEHCVDWLTEESARWEVQNDLFGEIYSVTEILDEEGNESENLIEKFHKN